MEGQSGGERQVKVMQEMIELFEMVSANDENLNSGEKLAMLKARFALSAFEDAMESFRREALAAAAVETAAYPTAA
jgi:hypothetical protein